MTEIKNKNVIVTGGAGFIGSTLVDRLCKNNKVLVIDNFHTGDCKGHRGIYRASVHGITVR